MKITKEIWGRTPEGNDIHRYTLENSKGCFVRLCDVGAAIVSIGVPDRDGKVADVVLYDRGIAQLPYARRLSAGAMTRIRRNHAAIIGVNTAIILLGVCGILSPALSALLHNSFTLGTSLFSMTPVDGGRRGYGHR